MKSITIKGSQRESVGKVATKAIRNAGLVPCVVYGGEGPIHFTAEEMAFKELVYTPDVFTVVLAIEGAGKINAILQDIQYHPVTDKIIHVDFYQIFDEKEITMEIPFRTSGNSRGVKNGGVLRVPRRKLKVRALPNDLPDFIETDITELKIGNKLYVTALKNDAYKIMHPENTVIAQIRTSRVAVADLGEEEEEEVDEETTQAESSEEVQATE
ncbi:MAG: 50S ribosomal protein L25 [Bacteroidetes bacterium HGW-Bacteroidetes-2]|jgi:large subunit ribosomal protein L25|nr:MAG: 50S ribosomal protein L25 [Bacteroidetes bacterium HGW-Bacteroidetes-2]